MNQIQKFARIADAVEQARTPLTIELRECVGILTVRLWFRIVPFVVRTRTVGIRRILELLDSVV